MAKEKETATRDSVLEQAYAEQKVLIDKLHAEIEDLNKKIESQTSANRQIIENLGAQLDASKQLFNDTLNSNFNLKTQSILLQRHIETLSKPKE